MSVLREDKRSVTWKVFSCAFCSNATFTNTNQVLSNSPLDVAGGRIKNTESVWNLRGDSLVGDRKLAWKILRNLLSWMDAAHRLGCSEGGSVPRSCQEGPAHTESGRPHDPAIRLPALAESRQGCPRMNLPATPADPERLQQPRSPGYQEAGPDSPCPDSGTSCVRCVPFRRVRAHEFRSISFRGLRVPVLETRSSLSGSAGFGSDEVTGWSVRARPGSADWKRTPPWRIPHKAREAEALISQNGERFRAPQSLDWHL